MPKPKSIAVLPFANMSTSNENEFFSDGITEEIINALTRIPGLKVTSRTSSFHFKNKNLPIAQIGQQLNVALLLEGSVRLAGNMMRITAQLIDAVEDIHFWSETWDRKIDNIFAIQDEVSLLIADKAREFLGHFDIQEQLVNPQTESYQAYEWYLKGRFYFRKWNPEDAHKSLTYFEKALELDPTHAESLLGVADALGFLATTGAMEHGIAWQRAAEAIHQALAMNNQLPEAHYQLSNLVFFTEGNFGKSLEAALKAHELNPNYAEVNQHLTFLYLVAGKNAEAKVHLDRILTLDPLSQETQFFKALYLYQQHEFAQSLGILNQSLQVNQLNVPAHTLKCYCLLKLGRTAEVKNYFDALPAGIVVEGDKLGVEALYYAFEGDDTHTQRVLKILEERAQKPEGFRENSFLLFLYAVLHQADKAFAWVANEVKQSAPFLLIHYSDVMVDDLKQDPRYQVFAQQIYAVKQVATPAKTSKKQLIASEEVATYAQQLRTYLTQERPYLDNNLSLKVLAQALELHANQLSWLINEEMGGNFNQLINSYRIQEFKKLAQDPANAHLSIIGLAFESGFNSKTVFNTYFKKETGLTPKQWMKSVD
jgi:TolB-like protein/AraC-like DNA-binding protein